MDIFKNTYLGSIFDQWKNASNVEDIFKDADSSRATGLLNSNTNNIGSGRGAGNYKQSSISSDPLRQFKTVSRNTNVDPNVKKQAMMFPSDTQKLATPSADTMYQDPIMTGGQGTQQAELGFMQRLANMANVDFDKAQATWKDKGGFEGLMANPAFTLGLAFMAAGAEGKSIGQESLNSVLKAGAISQQYKKIIKGRAGDVIEATEGQMNKVKSILGEMGISGPGWRKLLPGNQSASYEQAVEDITLKVNRKVRAMKKAAEKSGRNIEVGTRLYKKIIRDMIDSGEISKKRVFLDETLEAAEPKAMGGPIQAGKPYIVGEEGPEVIIPKSDGNVLTNDDSQIYAMLLAANPQLQKVSKQRAEKILRARFPEYFEG